MNFFSINRFYKVIQSTKIWKERKIWQRSLKIPQCEKYMVRRSMDKKVHFMKPLRCAGGGGGSSKLFSTVTDSMINLDFVTLITYAYWERHIENRASICDKFFEPLEHHHLYFFQLSTFHLNAVQLWWKIANNWNWRKNASKVYQEMWYQAWKIITEATHARKKYTCQAFH